MPFMGVFYKKEEDQIRRIAKREIIDFFTDYKNLKTAVEYYNQMQAQNDGDHTVKIERIQNSEK